MEIEASMQQFDVPQTTPGEVVSELANEDETQRPVIVDVREQDEWEGGHIADAMHIPLSQFRARYGEIPQDREVVLVCHLGERSQMAAAFLRRMGYEHAINLRGGMDAWIDDHLPVEHGA
jgi:rhodanese-related sulfurtransferase